MKKFRKVLTLALALVCSTIGASAASAQTITISETSVQGGYNVHWYNGSDGTGYTCTNGANEKASLTFSEAGYNMAVGLMKASTDEYLPVFLSSTNYGSTTLNKTYNMKYETALYKPYVGNYSPVSMTIRSGGTFTLE